MASKRLLAAALVVAAWHRQGEARGKSPFPEVKSLLRRLSEAAKGFEGVRDGARVSEDKRMIK
jgi:hypothetical protein